MNDLEVLRAFSDFDELASTDIVKGLALVRRGPVDVELGNLGGCPKADVFAEWVGSKAASAANVTVDGTFLVPFDEFGANLGADGRAI